jgi:TctA family transporter
MGHGSPLIFFKPPIALPVMTAAIIIFFMPAISGLFKKKRPSAVPG